jgi:regulator of protease activity HflC (stomatin/prohibitin superfamily)
MQQLPPQVSTRTAMLQRRINEAKNYKLTAVETLFSVVVPTFFSSFLLFLPGFITVPANTAVSIFRFGKFEQTIKTPGLVWVTPGYERIESFTGSQTHKMDSLHVVDSAGNPIIVRALLEYSIDDPAALRIATNSSLQVLFNQAELTVREACGRLPLLGEKGHDIRSQTNEIGAAMLLDLQTDASVFGIVVQRIAIVESRYAPEISQQMLMKQMAAATVSARKEITQGALNVVRDTLKEFPKLSDDARERLVGNLLVTMTSHVPTTPVLSLS